MKMKCIRLYMLLVSLCFTSLAFSQISHGGIPYFLQPSVLRSASKPFFVEMPSFNLDSVLREDTINEGNMRGSFHFAHKFFTDIDSNDAIQTVLPDGTTVKQIGIHSAGAYSINLLLRDFEIPPGGKLFVYNADHSYVAGSFDYRNNSEEKILPIQPVAGESIIVEYSEPANAPFKGHFVIFEVNHDYRDIFRAANEPSDVDVGTAFSCMQDVFCSDAAEETVRSTVLLIINGGDACTGSLLNNTANDGKPFLLTAVHCIVDTKDQGNKFPTDMNYYSDRAGTIITFFNYNRPFCATDLKMKGSEEMSIAGAVPITIYTNNDIALLELSSTPPDYYNAYYAGWNMDLNNPGTKHTNIHHPLRAVKKYGMAEGAIQMKTSPISFLNLDSFWEIPSWSIGSTANGSSGSPLFDENNLVIGGLSSGYSKCKEGGSPDGESDYFFALGKGWDGLINMLDPNQVARDSKKYGGMDPNKDNPVIRLANNYTNQSGSLIESKLNSPDDGYVFGNSNLQTLEFAEEFDINNPVEIFGAYLLLPAMDSTNTSGITISVYSGDSSPETLVYSTPFLPKYQTYSSSGGFGSTTKTTGTVPTETFVAFDTPVQIKGKRFFISYSVTYSTSAHFHVYNTQSPDANTAWVKDATRGWVSADQYDYFQQKTSLAIHSLIRYTSDNSILPIRMQNNGFYYERSGRILTLNEPLSAPGDVAIYSVSGQLLEKVRIPQNQQTVVLRERSKGTIGIVKISNDYFSCVGKIIY